MAADVLNAGEKVALLVGQGARNARAELLEAADVLGTCISKALLGKDTVPDDNPLVAGAIGLLGTKPSWDLMMGADTLLMVGTSFPYTQFLPDFGQVRSVEINIDPRMIGIRYPNEVNLVGDAKMTLRALLPMLRRKSDRSWQQTIQSEIEKWWTVVERRAHVEADPINPQLLFWELSTRLPDNAIVTSDSGSAANWYARDLKFRGDIRGSLSGNLATMGCGVPYAIGAKFAHPDRPVFALVGDGAMQMNGMNELLTASKYWQQWSDPRLVVLVLNNGDLNQVTWEMRAMAGDPKFDASQTVPAFDYARFAELAGLKGIRVERPDEVGSAWDEALACDRPCVVDAVVDPEVPPIPPHATFEEISQLTRSILKGDPAAPHFAKVGLKQKVQEFLPGR